MAYVFASIFVAACVVALIAAVVAIWNLLRVPFNLKPNTDRWAIFGNPMNYIFATDKLTDSGLRARRMAGRSGAIFVAAWVIGVVAGILAKWTV